VAVIFYLGTHMPHWLGFARVPLFVSHRRLVSRATLPRAVAPWALDSGGFTELSMYGRWKTPSMDYARAVRRYAKEIGHLAWVAPQDWMCEPSIREQTNRSVRDHQALTTDSVQELRELVGAEARVIPVLQGWTENEYHKHVEAYDRAGFDLRDEPIVGVGTVCRRQNTFEGARIVASLAALGLRLHGFGFKVTGLARVGCLMASADSMAWSYTARRSPPIAGHSHKTCANCLDYALMWRDRVLRQPSLDLCPAREAA
jgi:hypothetical protein